MGILTSSNWEDVDFSRKVSRGKQLYVRTGYLRGADTPSLADQLEAELFPEPTAAGEPAATWPGKSWLIAKSLQVNAWDPDRMASRPGSGEFPPNYPVLKCVIEYGTSDFDQSGKLTDGPGGAQGSTGGAPSGSSGDPTQTTVFITHEVDIGGEFLTWPGSTVQWSDQAVPDAGAVEGLAQRQYRAQSAVDGIIVPLIEHSVTWHFAPLPPWNSGVRALVGKVNAFSFCGAPPECLLFLGCKGKREQTNLGLRHWTLTMKFSEKNQNPLDPLNPQGWNHFARNSGRTAGLFQRLQRRVVRGNTTAVSWSNPTLVVRDFAGFPQTNGFYVTTGNTTSASTPSDPAKVTAGAGTDTWTLDINVFANPNYLVNELPIAVLKSDFSTSSAFIVVEDNPSFPPVPQFTIKICDQLGANIQAEEMVVWRVTKMAGSQVRYDLARNMNGAALSSGSSTPGFGHAVYLVPSRIYGIGNFAKLFMPGP